jgi:hypothetical protein
LGSEYQFVELDNMKVKNNSKWLGTISERLGGISAKLRGVST